MSRVTSADPTDGGVLIVAEHEGVEVVKVYPLEQPLAKSCHEACVLAEARAAEAAAPAPGPLAIPAEFTRDTTRGA